MQIDTALISRLEKLARLKLDDEARTQVTSDLQRILDMVDTLQTLDTTGVEPLVYLNEGQHSLRPDTVDQPLDRQAALHNAPQHDEQFFQVPKMLE